MSARIPDPKAVYTDEQEHLPSKQVVASPDPTNPKVGDVFERRVEVVGVGRDYVDFTVVSGTRPGAGHCLSKSFFAHEYQLSRPDWQARAEKAEAEAAVLAVQVKQMRAALQMQSQARGSYDDWGNFILDEETLQALRPVVASALDLPITDAEARVAALEAERDALATRLAELAHIISNWEATGENLTIERDALVERVAALEADKRILDFLDAGNVGSAYFPDLEDIGRVEFEVYNSADGEFGEGLTFRAAVAAAMEMAK